MNASGFFIVFGLMQRTKWAFVSASVVVSWLSWPRKCADTDANRPPLSPPPFFGFFSC